MSRKLGDRRKAAQVKPDKWHVYVATPAYDGRVDTDFSQALAESAFCSPLYQIMLTAGVMGNGAFIDLARNIFVRMFLEDHKDATHLFFIDSDLKWPPNAFVGLIRAGLPICAGVYRRRQRIEDYPARWTPNPDVGGLWVKDNWLMCDRVPTGFLCISRKVVEEMAADAVQMEVHGQPNLVPRLFYTKMTDDDPPRMMGEDFAFCDDYVAKYGEPIPVWTDIDFVHGGMACNFHDYLSRQIEAQEWSEKMDTKGAFEVGAA